MVQIMKIGVVGKEHKEFLFRKIRLCLREDLMVIALTMQIIFLEKAKNQSNFDLKVNWKLGEIIFKELRVMEQIMKIEV